MLILFFKNCWWFLRQCIKHAQFQFGVQFFLKKKNISYRPIIPLQFWAFCMFEHCCWGHFFQHGGIWVALVIGMNNCDLSGAVSPVSNHDMSVEINICKQSHDVHDLHTCVQRSLGECQNDLFAGVCMCVCGG